MMTAKEVLEKTKEIYGITEKYLGENKGVASFLGGCVVGLIFGIWIG